MVAPQFFTTWAYTTGANLVSTSGVFAGKAGRSGSDADVVLAELKKDGEVSMAHPTTAIKTSYSDDLSQYTIKPLDLVASSRGVQETYPVIISTDTVSSNQFKFTKRTFNKTSQVSIKLNEAQKLLNFGIFGRDFSKDHVSDANNYDSDNGLTGNVVFGDYERDERECHTTVQDLADQKAECEPAILLMPLADVLLHPEYKHFGAKTSVALMKLITAVKSKRSGKQIREKIYHIDFVSGFMMPRASDTPSDRVGHAWVGHWWMGGLRCYDRGRSALDLFRFYHEVFSVKPLTKTYLTYYLEIGNPKVWNLDTTEVKGFNY
ncbi:hypothetical protein MSG28_012860 [Choristoneura fumiferana]|uniref:Uncharacterized protein n=1 Tax=Choristoneura fumiferana TaxID=7141 RepID=A0ACC0JIA7_CHOFU|nr:hypothetical protein MSG28_012860 [Choristoneura fumiferana]